MRAAALLVAAALAACGETATESPAPPAAPAPAEPARPGAPPPPPDAGTERGHGADPTTVRVPEGDRSPPRATVAVDGLRDGRLPGPRFTATATGEDPDSGVARVRVSVKERLVCRRPGGRPFVRHRQRYFPPPQIERIRAAPGARLPTRASRARRLSVSAGRCGRGAAVHSAQLEVWGEATNGLGLEAVTDHLHARLGEAGA